ncbi:hypothetical protein HDU96_004178, partial [Phlyctochytrium bullatum]
SREVFPAEREPGDTLDLSKPRKRHPDQQHEDPPTSQPETSPAPSKENVTIASNSESQTLQSSQMLLAKSRESLQPTPRSVTQADKAPLDYGRSLEGLPPPASEQVDDVSLKTSSDDSEDEVNTLACFGIASEADTAAAVPLATAEDLGTGDNQEAILTFLGAGSSEQWGRRPRSTSNVPKSILKQRRGSTSSSAGLGYVAAAHPNHIDVGGHPSDSAIGNSALLDPGAGSSSVSRLPPSASSLNMQMNNRTYSTSSSNASTDQMIRSTSLADDELITLLEAFERWMLTRARLLYAWPGEEIPAMEDEGLVYYLSSGVFDIVSVETGALISRHYGPTLM